ncbi:MAG: hypothetical protein LBE37_14345 [Sphingobacterium sp.]|jgi:adenosyl cobinamide kinase/adenosyl cobinamide phosphate guanylyltransferase|nr:hypothetical protein [Sphingobacterium sp.]
MKKKPTTMRQCEVVTRLKDNDGNVLFNLEKLPTILGKSCIKEWAYIVHDQCKYEADEIKDCSTYNIGDLKPEHVHIVVKFDYPYPFKYIAKMFDLGENYISRINGKYEDALIYLSHRNAPDKHQYAYEEVKASFNYVEEMESIANKPDIDKILKRIHAGEIREFNKTLEIDHMVLNKYKRQIEDGFKIRSEYLEATQQDRNLSVIFLTGESQSGKTSFAKLIAKEKKLSYFVSSSSNDFMYGYKQQDVIIADDIRGSTFSLSDLLKMLDSNTASTVKSRYHNKFLNCSILILTTVLSIEDFYKNVFSEECEPITQLKRRCQTYIEFTKSHIYISQWDKKKMKYTSPITYNNPIKGMYIPKDNLTARDVETHVADLFPFLKKTDLAELDGSDFRPVEDEDKLPFN